MKTIEEIEKNPRIQLAIIEKLGDGGFYAMGTFRWTDRKNHDAFGSLVIGHKESGKFDHVSVALYNGKTPTWDQMCELKDAIWNDEEEVVQIHPKKSEYVNLKKNCLHLWSRVDGKRILEG